MQEIINVVQTLIDKGYAYELDGDVYYSVEKFDRYGELSGRKLEDMMAGARVDVNDKSITRLILRCGKQPNPANRTGKARGVTDARAGILNALP